MALSHFVSQLLWVSALCIGFQAALAILVSFPIANLYPAHRALVITVIGGVFDASSTVLMFYQLVYDAGIASLLTISVCYAISTIYILLRTIWLVPFRNVPYSLTEDYNVADYTAWQKYFGSELKIEKSEKIKEKSKEDGFLRSVARLANIPFLWTGCFYYLVAAFRQNMLVGSYNKWTRWIEDSDHNESYLTLMFGIIGFAEIPFSVLPGLLIDLFARTTNRKWGVMFCQVVAALLCGLLSATMGIRTREAAMTSIFLYYLFRTFCYGSMAVFSAEFFPPGFFGTIQGLLTITMMPATFAVPPLMIFMHDKGKSFNYIADICIIVTATMFIHPFTVSWALFKDRNKRVQPEKTSTELDNVQ